MHDVSKHARQEPLRRAGARALDTALARWTSSTSARGADIRRGGKGCSETSSRGGDRNPREEGSRQAQEGRRWHVAERWGAGVLGCGEAEGDLQRRTERAARDVGYRMVDGTRELRRSRRLCFLCRRWCLCKWRGHGAKFRRCLRWRKEGGWAFLGCRDECSVLFFNFPSSVSISKKSETM